MELTIRADVSTHMRELKQWLAQTRAEPAEDMNGFFAARVDTYEAHMSVWDKAYGLSLIHISRPARPIHRFPCGGTSSLPGAVQNAGTAPGPARRVRSRGIPYPFSFYAAAARRSKHLEQVKLQIIRLVHTPQDLSLIHIYRGAFFPRESVCVS